MPTRYSHTQQGRTVMLIAGAALLAAAIIVVIALTTAKAPLPSSVRLLIAGPILLSGASVWIFSRLTVEVDDAAVRWYFGRGIPRFSVPLLEVRSARVVTNPWFYGGIGIHFTPSGWLYNVAGGRAVEITKADGKRIRIGSDDADALLAAIDATRRG